MHLDRKTLRNVFLGVAACIFLYWLLHETDRVRSVYHFLKNIFSASCSSSVRALPLF